MTAPATALKHTAQNGAAEAIHVENLHKNFGKLHVLKGVSLSARDGEVIAIIGGSGSGKSTLLRCINCLENPTSGIIRVNGEEIKLKADSYGHTVPADRKQIERIRSKLGMVFQNFNLWSHMTLIENVIEVPVHVLGVKRDVAIGEAEKLLARVGLAEKTRRLSRLSVGRPTAARRDCQGVGHQPARHAVRRADLGARSGAGRRGAEGDRRPGARRPHYGAGHP
ncbi:ATP-binding cassette domain-containing protein [Mesorhizobium sp. C280B]